MIHNFHVVDRHSWKFFSTTFPARDGKKWCLKVKLIIAQAWVYTYKNGRMLSQLWHNNQVFKAHFHNASWSLELITQKSVQRVLCYNLQQNSFLDLVSKLMRPIVKCKSLLSGRVVAPRPQRTSAPWSRAWALSRTLLNLWPSLRAR